MKNHERMSTRLKMSRNYAEKGNILMSRQFGQINLPFGFQIVDHDRVKTRISGEGIVLEVLNSEFGVLINSKSKDAVKVSRVASILIEWLWSDAVE